MAPGGSNTDVQVNIAGNFYGDDDFTYDPATGTVSVPLLVTASVFNATSNPLPAATSALTGARAVVDDAILPSWLAPYDTTAPPAHNGTVVGAPTFGPAKFGNGLTATSDANYVSLPSGALVISSSNSWAISAWLKTTATATEVAISFGASLVPGVWFGQVPSGNFAVSSPGFSGGTALDSGIPINDGAWHLCVMQMTGGTSIETWVDGNPGATFSGAITETTQAGAIGKYLGAVSFSWTGAIDEVALWNSAVFSGTFTPPSAPYVGDEPGLFALYHLESDGTDSAAPARVTCPVFCDGTQWLTA